MVTYVVDASAALRFLDDQAGAERIAEIVRSHALNDARLITSAIQWGEIASVLYRRQEQSSISQTLLRLTGLGLEVHSVSPEQAIRSAMLQNKLKIPYADAFLVTLALSVSQSILITADFDFKAAEHLVAIEFLPTKS